MSVRNIFSPRTFWNASAVAGAAPKRCNQRSLPCSSVVGKCISISSFACYVLFFCFCISQKKNKQKKTVSARLKAMLQIPCIFFSLQFCYFRYPFFKTVRAPGRKTTKQNNNHVKMERWKLGLWVFGVELKKPEGRDAPLCRPDRCATLRSTVSGQWSFHRGQRAGAPEIAADFRLLKGWFKILANRPTSYYHNHCSHIRRYSMSPLTTLNACCFEIRSYSFHQNREEAEDFVIDGDS